MKSRILNPKSLLLTTASSLLAVASCGHSILDYGAVFNQSDTASAFQNQQAFLKALGAANYSNTDREVVVPASWTNQSDGSVQSNLVFTFMPIQMNALNDITFTIDGVIQLSDDYQSWPVTNGGV